MSSVSLPSLKKKFLKSPSGLPIVPFTEVLFRQLYEYNPKVIEEDESSYLIVLIQEMFHQIGKNGERQTLINHIIHIIHLPYRLQWR